MSLCTDRTHKQRCIQNHSFGVESAKKERGRSVSDPRPALARGTAGAGFTLQRSDHKNILTK